MMTVRSITSASVLVILMHEWVFSTGTLLQGAASQYSLTLILLMQAEGRPSLQEGFVKERIDRLSVGLDKGDILAESGVVNA